MKLGFNAWATNRCGHAQFAHKCQSSSWTRSPALWQRPHKYHTLLLSGTMHQGLKFRHRNTSDSICLTHVTKTESLTSCFLTLNQCWYWIPVKAAAANHWQNLIQVYLVIFPWFFASIMLLNGFFYCLFFLIGSLHGCFILKTDIHSCFEFCFDVHQLPGKISGNSPSLTN